jgi:cyclohexyl-isocyanide hydratase
MIIGIPVYQGVDLLDVAGPHEVFGWIGDEVEIRLVAASTGQPIVTRDKFSFNASHSFADTPQLDVLWVPGGDPPALRRMIHGDPNRDYLDFLIDRAGRAQWVCSVCEGALLLAAAGLLDGYRATTHWAFIPCLKNYDKVTVVDGLPRFCRDRNRLTGGGISSGLDESLELVRLLRGDTAAQDVQRTMQYYPDPPVQSAVQIPDRCRFQL